MSDNNTVFINTGFMKPSEAMNKARELFALAKEAEQQDKFVRVWCDKGDKAGFPYCQAYVDKWSKQDRWKWLKDRKAESDARKERKASNNDISGLIPPE